MVTPVMPASETQVPVVQETPVIYPGSIPIVSRQRPLKSSAFDLSEWHRGPSCARSFVSGIGGIGVKICCAPCGILCDVEATGTRMTIQSSFSPKPAVT